MEVEASPPAIPAPGPATAAAGSKSLEALLKGCQQQNDEDQAVYQRGEGVLESAEHCKAGVPEELLPLLVRSGRNGLGRHLKALKKLIEVRPQHESATHLTFC